MSSKKPEEIRRSETASEGTIESLPAPRRETKQALLLELISREGGATIEELTSATHWLPHTARSAITGLRRRGHDVRRVRIKGISRYFAGSGR